ARRGAELPGGGPATATLGLRGLLLGDSHRGSSGGGGNVLPGIERGRGDRGRARGVEDSGRRVVASKRRAITGPDPLVGTPPRGTAQVSSSKRSSSRAAQRGSTGGSPSSASGAGRSV